MAGGAGTEEEIKRRVTSLRGEAIVLTSTQPLSVHSKW